MTDKRSGTGCLLAMIVTSALLIGPFALSFAQGPFSDREQELWYRYGSIGFLLCGAILPALAVLLGARRAPWTIIFLVAWTFATLLVFFGYAILSGGGV